MKKVGRSTDDTPFANPSPSSAAHQNHASRRARMVAASGRQWYVQSLSRLLLVPAVRPSVQAGAAVRSLTWRSTSLPSVAGRR